MIKNNENFGFYIVFFTIMLLHVLLMAFTRLLPAVDAPMHLASATIYREFGNSANGFQNWFVLKNMVMQPNSIHHFFCGWPIFPSVEFANTVYFMLYMIIFPLSLLLVIRKFGGHPAYALLGFLVLYNNNFIWGFMGFFMSVPFVLLFLVILSDYFFKARKRDALFIILMFIVLFIMHGITTLLTIGFFGLALLWRYWKTPKTLIAKSLVLVPVLLLLARFFTTQGEEGGNAGGKSFLKELYYYYRDDYLATLFNRIGMLYRNNWLFNEGKWAMLLAASFSILLLFIIILNLKFSKQIFKAASPSKATYIPILFAAAVTLLWIIIPAPKRFISFSYERIDVFVFLALILFASLFFKKPFSKPVLYGIAVVCLIHFVMWMDFYRDFNKENQNLNAGFFPKADTHHVLTGLIYDAEFRGHPMYIHFPNYYIVWNKGIATPRFTDLGLTWRVGRKDDLPEYSEWLYRRIPREMEYYAEYENVSYLLVRGKMTDRAAAFFDDFQLVNSASKWELWERVTE